MMSLIVTVPPLSSDVIKSIGQPIEKAFDGSGFLYAASSKSELVTEYRWAFEEPGNKMSASPKWHNQFDAMLNLAYDDSKGVAGSLKKGVNSLDQWCAIRNRGEHVYALEQPTLI
jgi:hypothetical protein